MNSRLVILAIILLVVPLVHGEDWPAFRGPTGQGQYTGTVPTEWSTTKNIAWKQAIPGKGWSSPIIYQGRIYLTTAVPLQGNVTGDHSLRTLCLDMKTGKEIWNEEVFRQDGKSAPKVHTKNSHASPTPLTDGKRLFVHFGHQGTACLDLSGKVIWRNRDFKYSPVHGNGGSPILVDDLLIFSCDGSDQQVLVALDTQTGKPRWKTPRKTDAVKKFSFSTPLLIDVNGQKQIVSQGSDVLAAFEPKTGKEIWRVRTEGYSVVPRPVFGHGLVFISTGYDAPKFIAVRPDGNGDVTDTHIAWTHRRNAPLNPSPLLVGDELYIVADNGIATCLDARTGTVHWQQRLLGGYSASPFFADGKVYFQNEEGTTTVIKAGKAFDQIGKNALNERTLASFAAANGALFIRTEGQVWRVEGK